MENTSSTDTIFLRAIARAQKSFFLGKTTEAFEILLQSALSATDSEFGFIGEVQYSATGQPRIVPHAILGPSSNNGGHPAHSYDLDDLFGATLRTGEPVLCGPAGDDRVPDDGQARESAQPSPPLLGLPLKMTGALVGVLGLIGAKTYEKRQLDILKDFQQICGSLILAYTSQQLREKAESSLRESEFRLNAIVQSMAEGLITMDREGTIFSVNAAAEHFFGWTEKELHGQNIDRLLASLAPGPIDITKYLSGPGATKSGSRREALGKRRDGNEFPVELSVSRIQPGSLYVCLMRDITRRKRQEEALFTLQEKLLVANEKLAHNADTDPLTGVANRRFFDEKFTGEIQRAARQERALCLFLLDVDFFKNYNDHYGHQRGDECLKAVAHHTASALNREGEFLARIGGEEFAGILSGTMLDPEEYRQRVEAVIAGIRGMGIEHGNSSVCSFVTASAGAVVLVPDRDCTPEAVFREADEALYRAKQAGRDRVVFVEEKVPAE